MFSKLFNSNNKSDEVHENKDLLDETSKLNEGITEITLSPEVSIIITYRNEVENLKKTIDSIVNSKNKLSFEIIIVDDGSTDRCSDLIDLDSDKYTNVKFIYSDKLGTAKAKNLGADSAIGKYLFFCDPHISVPDYWLDNLISTLEESSADAVIPAIKDMLKENRGYGGTWNNVFKFIWLGKPDKNGAEILLAPGCTVGVKKETFHNIGGFNPHFQVYGVEDQELSLKLWLFGHKIILDSTVEVEHLFATNASYGVTHTDIIYNYLCLAYCHFSYENLTKMLIALKQNPHLSKASVRILLNENLIRQRKEYFSKRKYDENYIFEKFNIVL